MKQDIEVTTGHDTGDAYIDAKDAELKETQNQMEEESVTSSGVQKAELRSGPIVGLAVSPIIPENCNFESLYKKDSSSEEEGQFEMATEEPTGHGGKPALFS